MGGDYLTVKCSRCTSTSELKMEGVRTDIFLCPVCLEGEIEYQTESASIDKGASDWLIELRTLLTI